MSIEVSDYEPFSDDEIAAFHQDVRGVWQPSGTDQMRLLATIESQRAEVAALREANETLTTELAALREKLKRANRYHPDGRCRICGASPEGNARHIGRRVKVDHDMWCRYYVGPLTHEMHYEKLNGTFGGVDYRCRCGAYFRQGGMAGKDGDPVCPKAHETYRDIDAEIAAVGVAIPVETPTAETCRWNGFGVCLEHNAAYDPDEPGGAHCLAVTAGGQGATDDDFSELRDSLGIQGYLGRSE